MTDYSDTPKATEYSDRYRKYLDQMYYNKDKEEWNPLAKHAPSVGCGEEWAEFVAKNPTDKNYGAQAAAYATQKPKRDSYPCETKSALDKQIAGRHYDMPIQPIDFITKNALGWCEGNAIKYISRHDKKNGIEDLRKARHYLELLAEIAYGETL